VGIFLNYQRKTGQRIQVKFLEHDMGKTGPAGPWVIRQGIEHWTVDYTYTYGFFSIVRFKWA